MSGLVSRQLLEMELWRRCVLVTVRGCFEVLVQYHMEVPSRMLENAHMVEHLTAYPENHLFTHASGASSACRSDKSRCGIRIDDLMYSDRR